VKENKLIADFMGVQYKSDEDYFKELAEMREDGIFYEQGYMESQLNYHESWDWLMPVVGKITRDEKYWENEYREYLMDIIPYAIIEDVYDAVVGFIKNCVSLEKE
tara:strand:+ start:84 stop:398 length:315 start_codon:yes stop_codon:yes gene_type:complete